MIRRRNPSSEIQEDGAASHRANPPLIWLLPLVLLGFLGHYLKLPLFYGVEFIFGSIASFLILGLYGTTWAVVCAAIINLYTMRLWGHPWMMLVMTLQMLGAGLLLRRTRGSFVISAGLFWLFVGFPYVWLMFNFVLQVEPSAAWTAAMKSTLNEVLCALVANLILSFTPLRTRSVIPKDQLTSLFTTLFNLAASVALFPTFIIMVIHARGIVHGIEQDLRFNLASVADSVGSDLGHWNELHQATVQALSDLATELHLDTRSGELQRATRILTQATPEFQTMFVADRNGVTITHFPETGVAGVRTVGLDFSDRPYFQVTKSTRKPYISSAFQARGGTDEPVVVLTSPILINGEFGGLALASLNLKKIRELITVNGYATTILDDENQIVSSTRGDLHPLDRSWNHSAGYKLERMEDNYFRRVPDRSAPPMARWRDTVFGHERSIASLPGWKIIIEAPLAPYQATLHKQYSQSMALLLALLMVALAFSYLLADRMATPLAALARQTTDVPGKILRHTEIEWPRSGLPEVSNLISNFKKMAAELAQRFRDQEDITKSLQQSNRMKDEFLATLSHELRTPLNVLNGYIQLMREEGWTEEVNDYLSIMARNSENLQGIIEDLLDASRIITGKLILQKSTIDLSVVAAQAIQSIRLGAEAKSIRVRFEQPQQPPLVIGDASRLQQVLWNLLSNAIKFTPSGGEIEIKIGLTKRDVTLQVRDTGEGIAAEFLPHVFDRFRQENQTFTRTHGGLGLGLSIVRQIIELHGGKIEVTSEGKGKGTLFTVTLPRTESELGSHSNSPS